MSALRSQAQRRSSGVGSFLLILSLLLCSCEAKDRAREQVIENPLRVIPVQEIAAVVVGEMSDHSTCEVLNAQTIVDDQVARQVFEQVSQNDLRPSAYILWGELTPYVFLGRDGNVVAAGYLGYSSKSSIFKLHAARASAGKYFMDKSSFRDDVWVEVSDLNKVVMAYLTRTKKSLDFNVPFD